MQFSPLQGVTAPLEIVLSDGRTWARPTVIDYGACRSCAHFIPERFDGYAALGQCAFNPRLPPHLRANEEQLNYYGADEEGYRRVMSTYTCWFEPRFGDEVEYAHGDRWLAYTSQPELNNLGIDED